MRKLTQHELNLILEHCPRPIDLSYFDMSFLDLSGADLTEADLSRANLERADLERANLTGAILTEAILTEADLSGAILIAAKLERADLTEADLTEANLIGAKLYEADLYRADLSRANLIGAKFDKQQLEEACADGAIFEGGIIMNNELPIKLIRVKLMKDGMIDMEIEFCSIACENDRYIVVDNHYFNKYEKFKEEHNIEQVFNEVHITENSNDDIYANLFGVVGATMATDKSLDFAKAKIKHELSEFIKTKGVLYSSFDLERKL